MKRIFTTLIFLLISIIGYCQPVESAEILNPRYNDIELPQNPEVAAFGKYGLYDTNLFTGSPQISIPIFNHQGKEISLPISLTYDATGIKVEQTATNVGLGWNLQYGGVITREINHLPDDLSFDHGASLGGANYKRIYSSDARNIINKIHDLNIYKLHSDYSGYLPSGSTLAQADMLAREIWDFYKNIYVYDKMDLEPDAFRFNVNGMSDVILMDYETPIGSSYKAYARDNPNFKISAIYEPGEPGHNTKYIDRWIITDENGIEYHFDKQIKRHYRIEKDYPHQQGTLESLYERKYVEAWYLTKIESPNSYDEYEFNYSQGEVLNEDYLIDTKNNMAVSNYYFSTEYGNNNYVFTKPVISHINTSLQIHLNEIKYNTKTIFSTEVANRQDKPSSKRYTRLNIHNSKGQINQKIDLQQSYFKKTIEQNYNDHINSRLKLDGLSIYDTNPSEAKKYAFTYYNPYQIPEINSAAMDYWGYYNGRTSNPSLIVDSPGGVPYDTGNRTPNFSYAINGTLKSIFFPTGGRTSFYYEPHVIGLQNNLKFIGGIRLRKQVSFTLDEVGLEKSEEKVYVYEDLKAITGSPINNAGDVPKFNSYNSSGIDQQPLNFEKQSTVFHCTSGGDEPRSASKHQFSRNLAQKAPHNITYGEVSEVIFNNGTYTGHILYKFDNEYYDLSGDMAISGPYNEPFPNIGKILEKTVYGVKNSSYIPLQKSEYTYVEMINEEYNHLTKGVTVYGINTFFANVKIGLNNSGLFSKGRIILEECYNVVNSDGTINWALYNSIFEGGNFEELTHTYPNEIMHFMPYKHYSFFSKIATEKHTSYFDNNEVTRTIEYNYGSRPNHYMTTQTVSSFNEGNEVIEYITNYDYPHDLINNNPPETDHSHLQNLININKIGSPIKIKSFKDDLKLSTQRMFYESGNLKKVKSAKADLDLEDNFTVHLRDSKGNPVITSVGYGLQNYYIWGYNGYYLLGKISPIPEPYDPGNGPQTIFSGTVINIINSIVDQSNQPLPNNQTIKDQFKMLANELPNSMVSGYITNPGEGIISIIDPKHDILNFEYDDQKRLKKTFNKENKLLAENEYHYRELIINDDNVPDPPPPFSFSIEVSNYIDNSFTLTANNINGSNNGFIFNWSIVDAVSNITGSNTQYQNQYVIEYVCPENYNFSSNVVVRCDITNNETGMTITQFSNQLYHCPKDFSADDLVVEELRDQVGGQTVFQGLNLELTNFEGGTLGGVEIKWYYKKGDGIFIEIPIGDSTEGNPSQNPFNILPFGVGYFTMNDICNYNGPITFKCEVTDTLSSIEPLVMETLPMIISCSNEHQ